MKPSRRDLRSAVVGSLALVLSSACASVQVYAPGATAPPGPNAAIASTVFLVGDGGKVRSGDQLLRILKDEVAEAVRELGTDNVATVLLGDNIYPRGLPVGDDLDSPDGTALRLQLMAARASRTYAVLGNHDWNHTRRGGRERASHQIEAVERWAQENGSAGSVLPGWTCPLPVAKDVGRSFRLVFLDTQWWLHPDDDSAGYCPGTPGDPETLDRVRRELVALVSTAGGRRTMVVAHHPLVSGGPHGSRFSPRQHLLPLTDLHPALVLPLPVVGSLALALRPGFTSQDLRSSKYRRLRHWARKALEGHDLFAWVGGHEHGLQIIEGDSTIRYHLVSGAATSEKTEKWSPVAVLPGTRLAAARNGYLRLDGDRFGAVWITMTYLEDGGEVRRASVSLIVPDREAAPRRGQ